jgi:CDP-2,3-bis-(O-geranylgeranyl)-sn-glycerol synthase
MVYATVVGALWAILPAYVPNNAAVLAGGGAAIDGGRTLHGRRLLGDGKTWRGTLAGTLAGTALALALNAIQGVVAAVAGVPLATFPLAVAVALAGGAMLGDIAGSFVKRRLGTERGAPVPLLDQLDFVVGALVCSAVVDPDWFLGAFGPGEVVVVLLTTPLLHVVTNVGAYLLDLKSEPW